MKQHEALTLSFTNTVMFKRCFSPSCYLSHINTAAVPPQADQNMDTFLQEVCKEEEELVSNSLTRKADINTGERQ